MNELTIVCWLLALSACGMLACYKVGRWERRTQPATVHADTSTPARFTVESTTTGVIDLPPISVVTASVDVIVAPAAVREHETMSRELVEAYAEIARLNEALQVTDARLSREQQLHRKWVRFAHIARSRYRQAIVLGWEQPRRETRAKVLAEVIPIGTLAHPENVRFLMPTIRHDWIDRELVAA